MKITKDGGTFAAGTTWRQTGANCWGVALRQTREQWANNTSEFTEVES